MIQVAKNSSPNIAAFFDLDGTLLPAPSLEWRFAAYLLSCDEISSTSFARWLMRCLKGFVRAPWGLSRANKSYLAGLRTSLVSDWERSLSPDSVPIFSAGHDRIRWHLAQQHSVFFISGTLEPLAHVLARKIASSTDGIPCGQIQIVATRLESLSGYWTGYLAREHMCGEAKACAIRTVAAERGFDLSRSFAYGDEISDLRMLSAVGHPLAVNPSTRLERVARVHGWSVNNWRTLQALPALSRVSQPNTLPRSLSLGLIP